MDAPVRVRIERRRLVFAMTDHRLAIHASPKAAATAIRNACLAVQGIAVAAEADGQREAERWLVALEEVPSDCETVATVRHPVERVASLWADKVCGAGRMPGGLREAGVTRNMGLREFLRLIAWRWPDDPHAAPQSSLLAGLDRFRRRRIIRFEDLAGGWRALQQTYPFLPGLPVANATCSRLRAAALADREAVALATDLYRADMDAYGYG